MRNIPSFIIGSRKQEPSMRRSIIQLFLRTQMVKLAQMALMVSYALERLIPMRSLLIYQTKFSFPLRPRENRKSRRFIEIMRKFLSPTVKGTLLLFASSSCMNGKRVKLVIGTRGLRSRKFMTCQRCGM